MRTRRYLVRENKQIAESRIIDNTVPRFLGSLRVRNLVDPNKLVFMNKSSGHSCYISANRTSAAIAVVTVKYDATRFIKGIEWDRLFVCISIDLRKK